jgi:hypothetical protein
MEAQARGVGKRTERFVDQMEEVASKGESRELNRRSTDANDLKNGGPALKGRIAV